MSSFAGTLKKKEFNNDFQVLMVRKQKQFQSKNRIHFQLSYVDKDIKRI